MTVQGDLFGAVDAAAPGDEGAGEAAAGTAGDAINLRRELERYEAELIGRVLGSCDWNRTEAARRLGLPLRTLAHKMHVLGIRRVGTE